MPESYVVVLQACPEPATAAIQSALSRIFGIKEATCASVVSSAPIVLVGDLDRDQAAALVVALRGLELAGAELDWRDDPADELPRINWPRPPMILRQKLSDLAGEYDFALPNGSSLLAQLERLLDQRCGVESPEPAPRSAPGPERQVFEEVDLGEITPFSNRTVPSTPPRGSSRQSQESDINSRMDEIFPDDDGLIPNTQDITSILDRLLPDEERTPTGSGTGSASVNGSGSGFSVFLARITDDNRRQKAIPILQEMTGISYEEAEKLSRKVIIPVLKGVSKDDAETAKHRFAEIGVLARIKGG